MYQNKAATSYDAVEKIWSGPKKKDFYGSDMTLGEVALFMLSRNPEKVVQIMDSTGESLTAEQLIKHSKTMAKNLLKLGLQGGDVIGLYANNSTYLTPLVIAAFLCGAPINALYPGFDKESVEMVFKVTTPKIIICEVYNYETAKAASVELNLDAEIFIISGEITGIRNVKEFLNDVEDDLEVTSFPCSKLTGDDTAVILCSSGTTGSPKGVLCSHKSLLNLQVFPNVSTNAVLFSFSTMYWASGLWIFTAAILNGVKRIITDQDFSTEYFLQIVEKYNVSHMISAPHHIAQIIQNAQANTRDRLSSIDTIICSGSKVQQVISEKMNAILGDAPRAGLAVSYGMSELSTMLSQNNAGPGKRREGTEGQLTSNTEVRIMDKNTGLALSINMPGIINIRTPYPWRGYYRNVEATNKSRVNGWLVTGDIGYFDAEGFLHICSRDNDVFKSFNFQIYPEQIEEVVMQLPGVLQACVFGVPHFEAANLTACAILRTHNEAGRKLSAEDVALHVQQNMSEIYHIKAGVYFLEELPKTGSGKVQRRKVYELIKNTTEINQTK